MEAYLNELSIRTFSSNKDAKDAFALLGRCLRKMSEMGILNIRRTEMVMDVEVLAGQSFNRILNNDSVIDKDLKSVLMSKLYTLEPIDDLENKYNVLNFSYNGVSCKGLGWASEEIEDTVALGFKLDKVWENKRYDVEVKQLDDNGEEISITSKCKHVVTPEGIEALRDFINQKNNIPTHGKVLSKLSASFFPHLKFAEQALNQLEKIKDSSTVEQIFLRLMDLERVAANMTTSISPSTFRYKTTPESETRSRLPQLKILFKDGKKRDCSWHSRFTPNAGRIHFYYDEREKIFYVGYIGEKILD